MGLLWRRRSELHEDQINAIEHLPSNGKYLLLGPPGSGKTSILLHRGQYLRGFAGQSNTRLITFARTLKEFIAANGDDRFPPELIQTVASFVKEIFDAYEHQSPDTREYSFEDGNAIRAAAALELIANGYRRLIFQVLLADEVQDLNTSEILLLDELAPHLMVAGDNRQRLFNNNGGIAEFVRLGYTAVQLRHHFRISPAICRIADAISVEGDYRLQDWCRYRGPTPPNPQITGSLDRNAQIAHLIAALDIQFDTYRSEDDLIGIVVHQQVECEFIADELEAVDKFRGKIGIFHSGIVNRRFDPNWKICVMTIKSCKGLEFRALHWLFADENPYLTRSAAYTIVTRAKTSLSVYHNGRVKSFLAGAFPSRGRGLFDDDE